jgi:hypothetical protein
MRLIQEYQRSLYMYSNTKLGLTNLTMQTRVRSDGSPTHTWSPMHLNCIGITRTRLFPALEQRKENQFTPYNSLPARERRTAELIIPFNPGTKNHGLHPRRT